MSGAADHIRRASALSAIAAERRRQIEAEGWTPEHDDEHSDGALADAAACYAAGKCVSDLRGAEGTRFVNIWPRGWNFKPGSHRRRLVKAGALIVAEIERLDRAAVAIEPPGVPEPPFPIGGPNASNAKREGWRSFFIGRARADCPFPKARQDLQDGYVEGWDTAKAWKDAPDA